MMSRLPRIILYPYKALTWRRRFPDARIVVSDTPASFERHVFICGLHRSGTTLLENLLASSFPFTVLRADVPENEGQHMQNVYPSDHYHGGPGRFAFARAMHPAAPSAKKAARLRRRLMACWTPHLAGDAATLLEKSPPNLTRIPWLRAVFPGAAFLVLTRDPRAVSLSTRKWTGRPIEELMRHWDVAYAAAKRAMGSDCMHIRYEDLCADPAGTVARIGGWLSLDPLPASPGLTGRYAEIASSNDRYIDAFPPIALTDGAWTGFGYDLAGAEGTAR